MAAYEAMFNGDIDDDGDSGEENFVRCTRYGIDKSSDPPRIVFQTYTGTLMALEKVADYSDGETKSRQLNEQEWKLNRIVDLMIVDGQNNLDNGSNILWWVDICVAEVLPKIVSNIIRTFGLPPPWAPGRPGTCARAPRGRRSAPSDSARWLLCSPGTP